MIIIAIFLAVPEGVLVEHHIPLKREPYVISEGTSAKVVSIQRSWVRRLLGLHQRRGYNLTAGRRRSAHSRTTRTSAIKCSNGSRHLAWVRYKSYGEAMAALKAGVEKFLEEQARSAKSECERFAKEHNPCRNGAREER